MSLDAFSSLNLYRGCSSLFDECQLMHGQHFKTAALTGRPVYREYRLPQICTYINLRKCADTIVHEINKLQKNNVSRWVCSQP